MKKILLFSIFLFFVLLQLNAQKNNSSLFYFGGIQINTGKIVPHSNRVKHIKGDIFSVQAKIYHRIENLGNWNSPFKSTRFGYSLSYIHTNNQIIGDLWGVNMFMEPTIFRFGRINLNSHMGAGIAYASEKFDKESNPTNYMISTDFSFFFNARFQLDYALNKDFSLGVNAGFTHCSNAALYLPNLGINIFNYGLNLNYNINYISQTEKNHEKPFIEKKWANDIALGFATRNVNEELNKYYKIFTADYALNRFLNRKNILSFNLHYVLRQGEINDKIYSTTYNSYFGLAVGHELLIRKLAVLTQLGNYLYDTNLNENYWYARLGIRYYFTPKIFGMITLTNRKQSADYLQYALGYRF